MAEIEGGGFERGEVDKCGEVLWKKWEMQENGGVRIFGYLAICGDES